MTRASLLAACNASNAVDTQGLTPTLDYTKPATFLKGSAPHAFNPTVVYTKVVNGKYQTIQANGLTFQTPLS